MPKSVAKSALVAADYKLRISHRKSAADLHHVTVLFLISIGAIVKLLFSSSSNPLIIRGTLCYFFCQNNGTTEQRVQTEPPFFEPKPEMDAAGRRSIRMSLLGFPFLWNPLLSLAQKHVDFNLKTVVQHF